MDKSIKEVVKYMFSVSILKSLVMSYAYYIHEHVAWRTRINAKNRRSIRVHPTASIRNAENVYIGENSHININCCIWPGKDSKIILGDNLLMGPGVSIQAANHGTDKDDIMMLQERTQKDVIIGNDCWLGGNVTIVAGVTVPDGCIVAAGAVVTKSISEPYSIVAGVPAKVISYRKTRAEKEATKK